MVPFLFDPDRFLSFFCKTKPSCEFNLELSMFSFVQVVPMAGDSFLECTSQKKKKKTFLFRLGLNAIKQSWCNADIQMFSALSSMVHLDSKNFVFQ